MNTLFIVCLSFLFNLQSAGEGVPFASNCFHETEAAQYGVALKDVEYEINAESIGKQGKALVKVSVRCRKREMKYCLAAAVHGILFKGYASVNGVKAQKPMISQEDSEFHEDYFKQFFDFRNESFSGFAEIVPGTVVSTKVRGGYRIEAVVEVYKALLRKHLEDDGILKKMSEIL